MKQPIDLARKFLAVADNDIKAFQKLADASIGFHAQQAVEKCLKEIVNAIRRWADEQINGTSRS